MSKPSTLQEAKAFCISLLAQREHSRDELLRKLSVAGVAGEIARQAVAALAGEGAQSDERYAEVLVRSRHGRGYGPARIRRELAAQDITGEPAEQALAEFDWNAALTEAHAKKYGRTRPDSAKQYAGRMRFLTYRGFEPGAVAALLRRLGGDDSPSNDD